MSDVTYTVRDRERFLSKIQPEPMSGCWLWDAVAHPAGYGRFHMTVDGKRRTLYAHRVSYEFHKGPIPAGLCVRHRCDVPACVNPDHLELGTQADNVNDMKQRGRDRVGEVHRGESHATSKLTEADVAAMRESYAEGARQVELARRFGVAQSLVSRIVRREAWTHVD